MSGPWTTLWTTAWPRQAQTGASLLVIAATVLAGTLGAGAAVLAVGAFGALLVGAAVGHVAGRLLALWLRGLWWRCLR